jgi:uncharacterized oligopeptide transporter (OPT) family protein
MFDGVEGEALEKRIANNKEETFNKGLLFAAGLVAGEAVLGVIVALIIIIGGPGAIALFLKPSAIPGILGLLFIMTMIVYMVIRDHLGQLSGSQAGMVFSSIFRRR